MVATLWITEISSPFLHMRELLKELGYRDTDLNLAADVGFLSYASCFILNIHDYEKSIIIMFSDWFNRKSQISTLFCMFYVCSTGCICGDVFGGKDDWGSLPFVSDMESRQSIPHKGKLIRCKF